MTAPAEELGFDAVDAGGLETLVAPAAGTPVYGTDPDANGAPRA